MEKLRGHLNRELTSDLFTWDEMKKMLITLLLDQFCINLLGLLSTSLVSSVGPAAIAAVSMVGTINNMVSLVFTSLASGGGIVVARAKGRGDALEIRRTIGEVIALCGLSSIFLSGFLYGLAPVLVNTLYPSVEAQVTEYGIEYMRLMAISFLPYSVFCAIFNIFRNLGDTRSGLFLTLVINIVHLLLSLLFINGMGLGVTGSGYSYIFARIIGMAVALLWILKVHNPYAVRLTHFFRFSRHVTHEIMQLGLPMILESLLIQGGMLLVQVYLARLTTEDMAAHAVAGALYNLFQSPTGALTPLLGTVCGQCFGAGQLDLMKHYARKINSLGRFVILFMDLALLPLLPLMLRLYNASPGSYSTILTALGIGVASTILLWGDAYLNAMLLRVTGDGMYTSIVAFITLFLGRCLCGYLLALPLGLRCIGIWIGLAIEHLLRAVIFRLRLRGSRWLHVSQA